MKFRLIAAGLLAAALGSPASAQGIADDLRCILLSSVFAKRAENEEQRRVAAATGGFYLGRIEGKADAKVLAEALRSQSRTMSKEAAGEQMTACAAKLRSAEQALQAAQKPPTPAK